MFNFFNNRDSEEKQTLNQAIIEMIDHSQAMIEFGVDGTIRQANQNFLDTMGYAMDEILGKHHRMFVDEAYAKSAEYADFWAALAKGEYFTDRFARVSKSGDTVWIQATYAPVLDKTGKPERVIKIASDVTKRQRAIDMIATGLHQLNFGNIAHRVRMPTEGGKALDALAEAFNSSMERLETIIGTVGTVVEGIETSAGAVLKSSEQAAELARRNAANFEETAAEVGQITQLISGTSQAAEDARKQSENAVNLVDQGTEKMNKARVAMDEMNQAAAEMARINELIEAIAFQTNLLALNAGVEAARAGEAGAGFAVVATEIRNLAGQSSVASNQIEELITRSVSQAETTAQRMKESEEILNRILDSSRGVAHSMGQISSGAESQSHSIQAVNDTIADFAKGVERDAIAASENTKLSQHLSEYSNMLTAELSHFKTDRSGADDWEQDDLRDVG